MPEYAPGTPSWIELSSPDTDAAAEFYGALMGWQATEPGPPETGGYRMFQQDGLNVGGLMGIMQEGQPTAWATYVSVADADQTAAKVTAAGGSVMVEPMDVTDIGRMAVFADPTGAVFGVWQPKTFTGVGYYPLSSAETPTLLWNPGDTLAVSAATSSAERSRSPSSPDRSSSDTADSSSSSNTGFSTNSVLIISFNSSLFSASTLTICTSPGVSTCRCETFRFSLG